MVKHRKISADTRVVGRFEDRKFYLGKVTKVKTPKLVDVRFDDGDEQKKFEIKDLIIVDQGTPINAEPVSELVIAATASKKKRKNNANDAGAVVVSPPKKQSARKLRSSGKRVKQQSKKGQKAQARAAAHKKKSNLHVHKKVGKMIKKKCNGCVNCIYLYIYTFNLKINITCKYFLVIENSCTACTVNRFLNVNTGKTSKKELGDRTQ